MPLPPSSSMLRCSRSPEKSVETHRIPIVAYATAWRGFICVGVKRCHIHNSFGTGLERKRACQFIIRLAAIWAYGNLSCLTACRGTFSGSEHARPNVSPHFKAKSDQKQRSARMHLRARQQPPKKRRSMASTRQQPPDDIVTHSVLISQAPAS